MKTCGLALRGAETVINGAVPTISTEALLQLSQRGGGLLLLGRAGEGEKESNYDLER